MQHYEICNHLQQPLSIMDRMKKFNEKNDPFEIIDYENGLFGLLLNVHAEGLNQRFGQFAFDRFAFECEEEPKTKDGSYTHGNGYEWEAVFKYALQSDPKLPYVTFDSEAGMFCCRSNAFEILEELGNKFKAFCDDKSHFAQLVIQALSEKYDSGLEFKSQNKERKTVL